MLLMPGGPIVRTVGCTVGIWLVLSDIGDDIMT